MSPFQQVGDSLSSWMSAAPKLEITDPIVESIAVNMVDRLRPKKLAPELLLNNQSVFGNVVFASPLSRLDEDHPIAVNDDNSASIILVSGTQSVLIGTGFGAVLSCPRCSSRELLAANWAGPRDWFCGAGLRPTLTAIPNFGVRRERLRMALGAFEDVGLGYLLLSPEFPRSILIEEEPTVGYYNRFGGCCRHRRRTSVRRFHQSATTGEATCLDFLSSFAEESGTAPLASAPDGSALAADSGRPPDSSSVLRESWIFHNPHLPTVTVVVRYYNLRTQSSVYRADEINLVAYSSAAGVSPYALKSSAGWRSS